MTKKTSNIDETPEKENVTLQLENERRTVGFDSYDMTVREILGMVGAGEMNIAPEYQRKFVWDPVRQSQFIESVFLDIPIPPLFMASNRDGTWEVVDGVQRISTLAHFAGDGKQLGKIGLKERMELGGLEKLTSLNESSFEELPKSVQLKFLTRPLRVTTLNDKSDLNVRFDLFERLNSGGVKLQPQEIRNCIYQGPFNDLLKNLAKSKDFRKIVKLDAESQHNGTYEEMVLRFFAFLRGYKQFGHSVDDFLNAYMQDANQRLPSSNIIQRFEDTCAFLAGELPKGIVRSKRNITPINLYEAIAVGTALVLAANKQPKKGIIKSLVSDEDLRTMTTAGTNSRKMVVGRIEFVRDRLS